MGKAPRPGSRGIMKYRSGALACLVLGLCALAIAVFWPVKDAGFVNLDDDEYVASNPRVTAGLTADGVAWAFSSTMKGNWHPLTWLSLMLDVHFFGVNPARMHQVNILIHAANGVILFLLLRGLTGTLWRSALVAALFLAHPLLAAPTQANHPQEENKEDLDSLDHLTSFPNSSVSAAWRTHGRKISQVER